MHIPVSTYRLQLHRGFRFADVRGLIPYLYRLGVTDLYVSPLLRARTGSTHGYDVTDPGQWNPELGSPQILVELCDDLRRGHLSLLLDIVPNHMAASLENPWWRNLLESGVDSPFANWFDIDWKSRRQGSINRIVLPVLGLPLGRVLDRGEITLSFGEYGFLVRYFDQGFPVAMRSYARLLTMRREELSRRLAPTHPAWRELDEFLHRLHRVGRRHLPRSGGIPDAETQLANADAIRGDLWRLYEKHEPIRHWVDETVALFGDIRLPEGRRRMERLLAEQHYRLVWWKAAGREINYRRFFAISELVSIRVDQLPVFTAAHSLVKEWIDAGRIQGLRVDHIDGLRDPDLYLRRLRKLGDRGESLYLSVEKILEADESLPPRWPVQGTTGYDFLNLVMRLQVDAGGYRRLRKSYQQFIRRHIAFEDVVYGKKRQALISFFGGEMDGLTRRVKAFARLQQSDPGLSVHDAARSFLEITICLPVYRSYVRDHEVDAADREAIDRAAELGRRHAPDIDAAAWTWIRALLQMSPAAGIPPQHQEEWLELIRRWQQYTGAIMAKGHEDAALYVYVPLTSLNEVGGDPSLQPLSIVEFHQALTRRVKQWPHAMNATSTHDTKRSEDVRARIHVISEIPDEWRECVGRWSGWNRDHRCFVRGRPAPDRNTEYFFYQTLLGVLPMDWVRGSPGSADWEELRGRVNAYMLKAVREAKVQTRWTEPNPAFESALAHFIDAVFESGPRGVFFTDLLRLHRMIAPAGAVNSLSQLLLKLTAPGVPDFYQGTELWDLHLVDPDNRQPVNFDVCQRLLSNVSRESADANRIHDLLLRWPDGGIKMFVTCRGLGFRHRQAELFAEGDYLPLSVEGELSAHVCGFARRHQQAWSVTVVPLRIGRWMLGQSALSSIAWGDTRLVLPDDAPDEWHDIWIGRSVRADSKRLFLTEVCGEMPVALLSSDLAA